jgi:hypothetical protein
MVKKIQKLLRKSERGQAIILIAFAIIGLVSMVGLVSDTGILLIEYARLKRGIDAAAISSALQYRKNFTTVDLENAALEFLKLNQSDVFDIQVDTCDTDATLCTNPRRKLVRVTASRHVRFGFLRVIGINETDITATSVGEAASIDVVLVMDTSLSMAYQTNDDTDAGGPTLNRADPTDDPSVCNPAHTCEPLESIKGVATDFIRTLFFPYDRVSIVTMTSQTPETTRDGTARNPMVALQLNNDQTTIENAIDALNVFQPATCLDPLTDDLNPGTCLFKPGGSFTGPECPQYRNLNPANPSSCPSSNAGGALWLGGIQFTADTVIAPMNADSFWVIIALIGGPANASTPDNADAATFPFGYCPPSTWDDPINPFCRDASASSRHHADIPAEAIYYDADDYARDRADSLSNPVTGNGITIFTIGLGDPIIHATSGDADAGEKLLQYIATKAGDDTVNSPPAYTVNHGQYFFSPDAAGLQAIFTAIAKNIFTRLSQ